MISFEEYVTRRISYCERMIKESVEVDYHLSEFTVLHECLKNWKENCECIDSENDFKE